MLGGVGGRVPPSNLVNHVAVVDRSRHVYIAAPSCAAAALLLRKPPPLRLRCARRARDRGPAAFLARLSIKKTFIERGERCVRVRSNTRARSGVRARAGSGGEGRLNVRERARALVAAKVDRYSCIGTLRHTLSPPHASSPPALGRSLSCVSPRSPWPPCRTSFSPTWPTNRPRRGRAERSASSSPPRDAPPPLRQCGPS